jgi:hypothetical protein
LVERLVQGQKTLAQAAGLRRSVTLEPSPEAARQGAVAPLQGLGQLSRPYPGLRPGLCCGAPSGLKTRAPSEPGLAGREGTSGELLGNEAPSVWSAGACVTRRKVRPPSAAASCVAPEGRREGSQGCPAPLDSQACVWSRPGGARGTRPHPKGREAPSALPGRGGWAGRFQGRLRSPLAPIPPPLRGGITWRRGTRRNFPPRDTCYRFRPAGVPAWVSRSTRCGMPHPVLCHGGTPPAGKREHAPALQVIVGSAANNSPVISGRPALRTATEFASGIGTAALPGAPAEDLL